MKKHDAALKRMDLPLPTRLVALPTRRVLLRHPQVRALPVSAPLPVPSQASPCSVLYQTEANEYTHSSWRTAFLATSALGSARVHLSHHPLPKLKQYKRAAGAELDSNKGEKMTWEQVKAAVKTSLGVAASHTQMIQVHLNRQSSQIRRALVQQFASATSQHSCLNTGLPYAHGVPRG